ncbi:hypothetical protein GGQ85_000975 [Nitrobacter vulgaris]|nr:hypothetical protein [Nitrobacter vulgaris]
MLLERCEPAPPLALKWSKCFKQLAKMIGLRDPTHSDAYHNSRPEHQVNFGLTFLSAGGFVALGRFMRDHASVRLPLPDMQDWKCRSDRFQ